MLSYISDNSLFPSPCYVIEEKLLRRNLALIRDVAQRSNTEIILAFKAFALWKTFPIFREYISHSTASSPSEARLAFEEFGSRAHSYSPAYTEENIQTFIDCSDYITFNSLAQFRRFYPQTLKADHKISCGIRINPEYSEIETDLYNPCAPGSRFGVLAEELESLGASSSPVVTGPEELPEGIEGMHCHCHCESSAETLEHTLIYIEEKFGKWLPKLKWLNLGGGHLMTRKDYNVDLLVNLLNGLHERYPNLKLILEPGSAFAWQTGPLISQIVDIVENHGIRTAILNVSFACHMPDCLEMPYQPEVRGAEIISVPCSANQRSAAEGKANTSPSFSLPCSASPSPSFIYRLGGNSCLSGDFIGSWRFDHEPQIGEYIVFEDMIHYTTVKTHTFNGISHPAIAMLKADGSVEILREYTYEDYKHRMD